MIIKATSHTIKTIWMVILFILLVFFALIGTLIHGISIDSITLPKVKIEQLYIKLDKKIILTIDHVAIETQKRHESSLEESAVLISYFPYLNQFFRTITVNTLTYADTQLSFSYDNGIFAIESDVLRVKANVTPTDTYRLDIALLELDFKDIHLSMDGNISVDLEKHHHTFKGNFETFGIKGRADLTLVETLLSYHLESALFTNTQLGDLVTFLAPKAALEPLAKAWIHENIVGESYEIHYINGVFDLKTEDYFPNEIKGSATVKKASITFEPTVPAAHVDEIGILFKNDSLIFDVKEATYENKAVQNADVFIYNLINKGTGIVVDLNASSKLDAPIHKILHAFKINIPIVQTSGSTQSHIRLDIKFLPYDINASGEFTLQPSNFLLDGIPMSSRYGTIRLENKHVFLDKANLVYKTLFDINATGLYDTSSDRFEGSMDINTLSLKFGETHLLSIASLADQEAYLVIDKNTTRIALPTFESTLSFKEKSNVFTFKDMMLLKNYSPLMDQLNLSAGTVLVRTHDFENFEANISLHKLSTPFLENNSSVENLNLFLKTNSHIVDANTFDQKLSLHYDKALRVHINDLNLSVPKEDSSFDTPIPIVLHGKNSSILIKDTPKSIMSDAYTIALKGSELSIKSKKGKTEFEVEKKSKYFSLHSASMDDYFTNALLGNSYFNGGNFSLNLEGKSSEDNHGTFILQNTYIKELKFFNNLMATINAIPSLIVFTDPNFNQKGYFVQNGFIDLDQEGDCFTIKDMLLRGSSADIVGNGQVNFADNSIALDLQIRTLKTFSSIIDMIPLVGGLILGEDKKISTHITVSGTIDNPKVETHLVTDALMTPLNIIKRTIELPLELFK